MNGLLEMSNDTLWLDCRLTIGIVFEIRSILLFSLGYQRLVGFWESPSNSLGEAETDFFLQGSDHESFFGMY